MFFQKGADDSDLVLASARLLRNICIVGTYKITKMYLLLTYNFNDAIRIVCENLRRKR